MNLSCAPSLLKVTPDKKWLFYIKKATLNIRKCYPFVPRILVTREPWKSNESSLENATGSSLIFQSRVRDNMPYVHLQQVNENQRDDKLLFLALLPARSAFLLRYHSEGRFLSKECFILSRFSRKQLKRKAQSIRYSLFCILMPDPTVPPLSLRGSFSLQGMFYS